MLTSALATACGRPKQPLTDSVPDGAVESAIAAGIVSETIPSAPHHWDAGSVDTFMMRNVPAAKRVKTPPPVVGLQPGAGDGVGFSTDGMRIQFHVYGDPVAAGRVAARLMPFQGDSVRLFTSNNLLVLIAPADAPASDRLERALRSHDFRSAGPPRP